MGWYAEVYSFFHNTFHGPIFTIRNGMETTITYVAFGTFTKWIRVTVTESDVGVTGH